MYNDEVAPAADAVEFICPQCGAREWGTHGATSTDLTDAMGHCHGSGCNFTRRRGDDAQVFRPIPEAARG